MNKIHLTAKTSVSPERVVQALTDFGPQRVKILSNIDPGHYQVHSVGATSADVTEGSAFLGGIWERSTYDWSRPGEVTITLQSSNAFATGGYWHYHISRTEDGGSLVELDVDRRGKKTLLLPITRAFASHLKSSATRSGCISASHSVFGLVEELLAQRGIVVTYETVRQ